jgi:hypothetical protein
VVARAHWLESLVDFTSFTGAAFPTMDITIPAFATVQRVIFSIACAGVQSSAATNDYRQVQGVYLLNKIVIDYPGRSLHTLHEEKLIVPASTHALFDASLLTAGATNRFFYALYQGGDRELGCNIRTSWGGPTAFNPYVVSIRSGLFRVGATTFGDVNFGIVMKLRVLYYSTP